MPGTWSWFIPPRARRKIAYRGGRIASDYRGEPDLRANREVALERASRGCDGIELHDLVLIEQRDPERATDRDDDNWFAPIVPWSATAHGPLTVESVRSIRWSCGPESDATHTAPSCSTSPSGVVPASCNVAPTVLVLRSIRVARPARRCSIPRRPRMPRASAADPTRRRSWRSPSGAGSIRDTDPSTKFGDPEARHAPSANRGRARHPRFSVIRSSPGRSGPTVVIVLADDPRDPGVPASPPARDRRDRGHHGVPCPIDPETGTSSEFETRIDPAADATSSGTPPTGIPSRGSSRPPDRRA